MTDKKTIIRKIMNSEISWLIGFTMTIGSVIFNNVNMTNTIVNQVNLVSQKLEAHITEDTKLSDKFEITLDNLSKTIVTVKENVAVMGSMIGYKNKESNNL